jgi:hypothetical protein
LCSSSLNMLDWLLSIRSTIACCNLPIFLGA